MKSRVSAINKGQFGGVVGIWPSIQFPASQSFQQHRQVISCFKPNTEGPESFLEFPDFSWCLAAGTPPRLPTSTLVFLWGKRSDMRALPNLMAGTSHPDKKPMHLEGWKCPQGGDGCYPHLRKSWRKISHQFVSGREIGDFPALFDLFLENMRQQERLACSIRRKEGHNLQWREHLFDKPFCGFRPFCGCSKWRTDRRIPGHFKPGSKQEWSHKGSYQDILACQHLFYYCELPGKSPPVNVFTDPRTLPFRKTSWLRFGDPVMNGSQDTQ